MLQLIIEEAVIEFLNIRPRNVENRDEKKKSIPQKYTYKDISYGNVVVVSHRKKSNIVIKLILL